RAATGTSSAVPSPQRARRTTPGSGGTGATASPAGPCAPAAPSPSTAPSKPSSTGRSKVGYRSALDGELVGDPAERRKAAYHHDGRGDEAAAEAGRAPGCFVRL